ncbi:MAG: GNAT family N-acetyltransferase [Lachnospiraceae bacterium]|nr:GNAT family N-acetyltransferase [Lachnospiraceae bacterium]
MEIRYVEKNDKEFWFRLDRHLSQVEFEKKIRDKMGYILLENDKPIALLRYNLFWDNTPFCTMLFVDWENQGKGYGKALMSFWEKDMKEAGYGMIMTSTQVDEEAQHFYRKLGYKDAGAVVINIPKYEQPMEMIMIKEI